MVRENFGNDPFNLTSHEFALCVSYLMGKEPDQEEALRIMKSLGAVPKPGRGYYLVLREKAWNYFTERYAERMRKKSVGGLEELLQRAGLYADD